MQVLVNVQLLPDYKGEAEATQRVVEELVKCGFIVDRVIIKLGFISGIIDFEILGAIKRVTGVSIVALDRQVTTP